VLSSFVTVIMSDEQVQQHYDDFFEEVFVELEDKVCSTSKLQNNIC
jgi:hypothetical protein